jgi:hypothetical protein
MKGNIMEALGFIVLISAAFLVAVPLGIAAIGVVLVLGGNAWR